VEAACEHGNKPSDFINMANCLGARKRTVLHGISNGGTGGKLEVVSAVYVADIYHSPFPVFPYLSKFDIVTLKVKL
jgi:hypothetical protein